MPKGPRKTKKRASTPVTSRAVGSRGTSTRHHRDTARFWRASDLLAKKLRLLRRSRELTIDQACERAEVEPMTWYRLENRKANPTLALLCSVAAAFGLTVSELLGDEVSNS